MTHHPDHSAEQISPEPPAHRTATTLAEDTLLLLFQPSSGSIAGENTLFHLLGGATLIELAQRDLITATGERTDRIAARTTSPPHEELLRPAWDYLAKKPRHPQTVIAAVGPTLRGQVIEQLLATGHLRRIRTRFLGVVPRDRIVLGSSRRDELLAQVRAVLVDEAPADARTAALIALLSASAQLHQLDPEIPWTSPVIQRAREYEAGSRIAQAAGLSIAQSTFLVITALAASAASSR